MPAIYVPASLGIPLPRSCSQKFTDALHEGYQEMLEMGLRGSDSIYCLRLATCFNPPRRSSYGVQQQVGDIQGNDDGVK